MANIRISQAARNDIKAILAYSLSNFGTVTKDRYKQLIEQAITDIATEPTCIGVRPILGLTDYYSYHLKMSTSRIQGKTIKNPSHHLIFRWCDEETLEITRCLHERMLVENHIND